MSRLNVLVVGASIAGPATAYWLARAGHTVTVLERFSEIRKGGQSVDIRLTGVTIMKRMPGVEAAVRARRPPMGEWNLVNEEGKVFAKIVPSGDTERQGMISEYEIFRGDLNRILYDKTSHLERVSYVFDEQVTSLQQDEDGNGPITATFLNGHLPTAEYDLVVACDGNTSRTRAMGLKCDVSDHIQPSFSWAAFCSIKRDLLSGSAATYGLSSVGGRFIGLSQDFLPNSNRVMFQAFFPKSTKDPNKSFLVAQKEGTCALKKHVADHFEGMGWRTKELVELMKDSDDFYASEWAQVKTPKLSQGRFVLVGDAGYSSGVGTGTTLALTGAYVLAGEIDKHKGDLAVGLKAYEQRMRPIIDDMQKIPPLFPAIFAPQTKSDIWIRERLISLGSRVINLLSPLFGSAFASGDKDKYGLPEYDFEKEDSKT